MSRLDRSRLITLAIGAAGCAYFAFDLIRCTPAIWFWLLFALAYWWMHGFLSAELRKPGPVTVRCDLCDRVTRWQQHKAATAARQAEQAEATAAPTHESTPGS